MKRLMLGGWLLLVVAHLASAQPSPTYVNLGTLNAPPASPPQIDATVFDNEGLFNLGLADYAGANNLGYNGAFVFSLTLPPFEFSDVDYYTNRGTMSCDAGFNFTFYPSTNGFPRMSTSFGNANTGVIRAGSASSTFTTNLVFFAISNILGNLNILPTVPLLTVNASNIVNTGTLDVGSEGLLTVTGVDVNLRKGTLHVEGFDDTNVVSVLGATLGIFGEYEGIGLQTNELGIFQNAGGSFPGNLALPYPASPINNATNTAGVATISFVAPQLAPAFVNTNWPNPSNECIQVVYINTNLSGITTQVRFDQFRFNSGFAVPVIQWEAAITNKGGLTGQTVITNDLYLTDIFGEFPTNYLVTGGFTLSGITQPQPFNYSFYRTYPIFNFLPQANATFDNTIYNGAFPQTNAYATYGVSLGAVTSFPDPTLPGSTFTNVPGRIVINASHTLDLTSAKVTGANYLNIASTNHFAGSANASIVSPYMDISLGTTNGMLNVTNVVAPLVPRFTGTIDMWSGRWTNIVAGGVTNSYHILIVNAQLAPVATPLVLNCNLRSTNVVLSDALNINQTLLINANNLTITSNGPAAPTPYGQLNLLSSDILWGSSLPVLQNLTNFGLITALNTTYFENGQQLAYYETNFTPYQSFVNHGLITTDGNAIWANYFENTGVGSIITNTSYVTTTTNRSAMIYSTTGPINLQSPTALLTSGTFDALAGDISIRAGTLLVSNHDLLTSGALTLTVTNLITDGGPAASSNAWSVGDGMNLPIKPPTGDLLGTTITNSAPAGVEVINVWAGTDVGASAAGYANNVAVGRLILNGGDVYSQFYFGGPDTKANYAIYVDQLQLANWATNRSVVNGIENWTAFDIADNMIVYFADATIGAFDVSEKLNGANGGHLIWVPSYAGAFSATNMVYPSGHTYTFNRALAQSTTIDSNGNGSVNAFDPTPIYTSDSVNMTVSMTNHPAATPVIKWAGLANSTNYLYYKSSLASTNWVLVTNFVQGPANGTVTVVDYGRTNSVGYYKVQVNARQP